MEIRTLLVPVADEKAGRQALLAAIPLARRFSAHLTALHVRYDPTMPMPYVAGPIPADMLVELSSSAVKLAEELAARHKAMVMAVYAEAGVASHGAPGAGISGEWREDSGNLDYSYGAAGRVYDLAVVAQPVKGGTEVMTDVLEGLLFYSGRPVLMVPAEPVETIGSRAIIAWNGSREGARAVSAAMPFLKRAQKVVILTVGSDVEDRDGPSGQALADSLKWHGVSAEVMSSGEAGLSDGAAILKMTEKLQADLLVTGAYSHSRLRSLILGGVTHDVIAHAALPVLFGH